LYKIIFMATKLAEIPLLDKKIEKKIPFAKPITWEHFKNRYLSREDEYTYEWVNGCVEKTKRTMDYKQFFIVRNLMNFFIALTKGNNIEGLLTNEVDTYFAGNLRRPDMCYLTNEQMDAARLQTPPVPKFVIEIISNNDKAKRVQGKMVDYWAAEIPVIWHIFPDLEHVHVYNGKKMTVLMKDELCSAAPVLPEFVISVNDIFK